jgi:hypothetical protein
MVSGGLVWEEGQLKDKRLLQKQQQRQRRERYGLKGSSGCGEWNASGSFPFDRLRVRMTAETCNSLRSLEAGFGFGGHVIDDCLEVAGFTEDFELAVGAGALVEHGVDVGDLFAAAEFVKDVVDEG